LFGLLLILIGIAILLIVRYTLFREKVPPINSNIRTLTIILSIIGAILTLTQSTQLQDNLQKKAWIVSDAIIIKSEIVGERAIRPQIEYVYQVDHLNYTGETDLDVPMFGGKRKKYDVARESIKNFQVGDTISIFYNPVNPEQSFYRWQIKWNVFGKLGFGFLLLLTGIFFSSFPRKRLVSGK
jgi:hypothetical protein